MTFQFPKFTQLAKKCKIPLNFWKLQSWSAHLYFTNTRIPSHTLKQIFNQFSCKIFSFEKTSVPFLSFTPFQISHHRKKHPPNQFLFNYAHHNIIFKNSLTANRQTSHILTIFFHPIGLPSVTNGTSAIVSGLKLPTEPRTRPIHPKGFTSYKSEGKMWKNITPVPFSSGFGRPESPSVKKKPHTRHHRFDDEDVKENNVLLQMTFL